MTRSPTDTTDGGKIRAGPWLPREDEVHSQGSRNLKQSPPCTTADTGRQIQGAGSKGQASYHLQGWVFFEPPLPTRPCLLKTPQPPKTVLPARNRRREHEPVGTISESNHHTVDQLPPPSPSLFQKHKGANKY